MLDPLSRGPVPTLGSRCCVPSPASWRQPYYSYCCSGSDLRLKVWAGPCLVSPQSAIIYSLLRCWSSGQYQACSCQSPSQTRSPASRLAFVLDFPTGCALTICYLHALISLLCFACICVFQMWTSPPTYWVINSLKAGQCWHCDIYGIF